MGQSAFRPEQTHVPVPGRSIPQAETQPLVTPVHGGVVGYRYLRHGGTGLAAFIQHHVRAIDVLVYSRGIGCGSPDDG